MITMTTQELARLMLTSDVVIDEYCTDEYYIGTEKRELWDHHETHTFPEHPSVEMTIMRTYRTTESGITKLSFDRIIDDPVHLDGMRVVDDAEKELDGWAIVRSLGMM